MKTIHVVAAIIYNQHRDQLLIARRPKHLHQGGLWEFPGGKVEAGEAPLAALQRELQEELAIDIDSNTCQLFTDLVHDYTDKRVHLEFWQVMGFSGLPKGNEGQAIAWVALSDLSQYAFPEANQAVVQKLLA